MADKWKHVASSTMTPVGNTKREEVVIKVPEIIFGIHSNVSSSAYFADGHAWLSVLRDGVVTRYGLWPDDHPRIAAMGLSDKKKSDIRIGMEDGQASQGVRHYRLTVKQTMVLEEKLRENIEWNYTNTCASWSSETVYAVTGEDVDADDIMGFETPRELTKSIAKLEKIRPTSIRNPKSTPDDAHAATSKK